MAQEDNITIRDAAKECGRNPETVRRWVWSGKLSAQKLGNQIFIKRSDLESYCRETAVAEYRPVDKADSFDTMRDLRDSIRTGADTANLDKPNEENREARMEALERASTQRKRRGYDSGTRADFLDRATALQERIRNRGGKPIDTADLIHHIRTERTRSQVTVSASTIRPGSRSDLIERMRELRKEIRTRVGNLDVDGTLEELRQERLSETTGLR